MNFHKGRATDAVFESDLPSIQKLILLCYIKHANADGVAWPGGNRVASLTGASLASIKRHRSALMQAGILVKIGGGDGNVYRFQINVSNLTTGVSVTPVSDSDRYHSDTSTGVTVIPLPVSQRDPNIHKENHTQKKHSTPSAVVSEQKKVNRDLQKVKQVWQSLMSISEQSDKSSHRLKLTPWRQSMVSQRMKTYTADEIIHAWTWWNESMHQQAIYLRSNRGPAGIDTFLRRSNHDKYQAFAADWKPVIIEPGPNASIEEMKQWLDYKNRMSIVGK